MPRFIENYQLEVIQNLTIDDMEHFIGKQNVSGKLFILKRYKLKPNHNSQQPAQKNRPSANQQLFQRLTHQTLILKNISHSSIPKCIRMLKTNNSIYYVWEFHPLMSLSEFLTKYSLKITEKIQISINILQALTYLHHKNIVYCRLNSHNVKIDRNRQIFLTNFKDAVKMESDSQKFLNQQQIIRQKQFLTLIFQEIYDTAVLFFQIFQLKKVNPKIYHFSSVMEKKLYQALSSILNNDIKTFSLDHIKKILIEKVNIRQTACTQASDSVLSPNLLSIVSKESQITTKSDSERFFQTQKNSVSCSKITLHNAFKRTELLRDDMQKSRQSQVNVSSSFLKTSDQKYTIATKTLIPCRQKPQSQHEIKKIIENRKLVNLMLEFLKFIPNQNNLKLIYLIGLKCEFYSELIRNFIDKCSTYILGKRQMDFFKIVNCQNIKVQDFVTNLKNSLKQIIQENSPSNLQFYQLLDQAAIKRKAQIIQENLTKEIHKYLHNQVYFQPFVQNRSNSHSFQVGQENGARQTQGQKDVMRTKVKRTVSVLESHPIAGESNYQNYKFYYYLSIQLKYGKFDNFFERSNTQMYNLRLFSDYFPFEKKGVDLERISMEVKSRIDKFSYKTFNWNHKQKRGF